MLQVRDLEAFYGSSQALFGISIKAPARGAIAVLGRNGAGKSTLLKALFGGNALGFCDALTGILFFRQ